jgi:cyanophycinase
MKAILFLLSAIILHISAHAQMSNGSVNKTNTAFIGIMGDTADVQPKNVKQGFLLAGGSTDVDEGMKWLLDLADGGDVVIIRASGSTGYNKYLFELGKVNSVESLLINSAELANSEAVAQRIRQAECLFIAGGDQWNYVNFWMGTPVGDAINYLINDKRVPVGGTSAGLAVLGQFVYDAKNGGINSEEALANPYTAKLTLTKDFLKIDGLRNVITDSHYSQRKREGRHIAFMARMFDEGLKTVKGIGVDEKTAVAVDAKGNAKVFGVANAYFYKTNAKPDTCTMGKKLEWYANGKALQVYIVQGNKTGNGFINIPKWKRLSGGIKKNVFVKDGVVSFL